MNKTTLDKWDNIVAIENFYLDCDAEREFIDDIEFITGIEIANSSHVRTGDIFTILDDTVYHYSGRNYEIDLIGDWETLRIINPPIDFYLAVKNDDYSVGYLLDIDKFRDKFEEENYIENKYDNEEEVSMNEVSQGAVEVVKSLKCGKTIVTEDDIVTVIDLNGDVFKGRIEKITDDKIALDTSEKYRNSETIISINKIANIINEVNISKDPEDVSNMFNNIDRLPNIKDTIEWKACKDYMASRH